MLILVGGFAAIVSGLITDWRDADGSDVMLALGPFLPYLIFGGIIVAIIVYVLRGERG